MSLESIINALVSLGLPRTDAEIYIYIARKGIQKISSLQNSFLFSKKQISTSLINLKNKSLVKENKSGFFALPFEEALELLIKNQHHEEKLLIEIRKIFIKKP